MATIDWQTGIPSDGSAVGLGARDVRDQKRAISEGLSESQNFLDNTEPWKQGSARPFIDVESNVSHTVTGGVLGTDPNNDRAIFASDTSRLFVLTSYGVNSPPTDSEAVVYRVGDPSFIEHRNSPGRDQWIHASGMTELTAPDTRTFTLAYNSVVFDSQPFLQVSSSDTAYEITMSDVTEGGFRAVIQPITGLAASDITLFWFASGKTDGTV